MNAFSLPAPAKLNLFLHITGQRTDGYHELQTLFALLDYHDTLHFSTSDTLQLSAPAGMPSGDDNLIIRAAKALARTADITPKAHIRLDKRLPAGAGLGGGSSDAATTLLALNHLWDLNLSIDALAQLGLTLGADVPLFVRGTSAWAEGVGEQLQPVSLPDQHYFVLYPDVNIPTKQIFSTQQLTRDTPKSRLATFLGSDSQQRFRNDCETIAARHFPAVRAALDWLEKHAGNARMTGTGACVFARIADRATGGELLKQLPEPWKGFVACSINQSPAHQALIALQGTTR